METTISKKQSIYAVAYRYGKNNQGTYVSIIVGTENATARSPFSIFGDPKTLAMIGINPTQLDYPESGSQIEELEKPVELYKAHLCTTTHAPVRINERTYRTLSFVVTSEAEADTQADYLVQRRFDQATGFFKSSGNKADYKRFVLGDPVSADEILAWLETI